MVWMLLDYHQNKLRGQIQIRSVVLSGVFIILLLLLHSTDPKSNYINIKLFGTLISVLQECLLVQMN